MLFLVQVSVIYDQHQVSEMTKCIHIHYQSFVTYSLTDFIDSLSQNYLLNYKIGFITRHIYIIETITTSAPRFA